MQRILLALFLLLAGWWLSGCAHKARPGATPNLLKIPNGYVQNGFCMPSAIDTKGKTSEVICKGADGTIVVYRRIEEAK